MRYHMRGRHSAKKLFLFFAIVLVGAIVISNILISKAMRRADRSAAQTRAVPTIPHRAILESPQGERSDRAISGAAFNPFAPDTPIIPAPAAAQKPTRSADNKTIYEPSINTMILVQ